MSEDIEKTKLEERGKNTRTLIWVGVILFILLSPIVCCVLSSILTAGVQ